MTQMTKEVGTNVISTMSVAMGIPVSRFEVLLALAKGAVNYQPPEGTQEEMAASWNTHMVTVTASLPPNEAVVFGAIVAMYLHEGILDQMGMQETDDPAVTAEHVQEMTAEGEAVWPTTGTEGWLKDSFRDVT